MCGSWVRVRMRPQAIARLDRDLLLRWHTQTYTTFRVHITSVEVLLTPSLSVGLHGGRVGSNKRTTLVVGVGKKRPPGWWAFSYERGTPVGFGVSRLWVPKKLSSIPVYSATWLIRKRLPLGPFMYSRTLGMVLL
jgi:hypothetical protein